MVRYLHAHERVVLNVLALVAFVLALAAGPQVAHHVGTFAAVVGSVAAWTFVLKYRQYRWRTYDEGRHLMAFTLLLAVILSYVSVRALTGGVVLAIHDEAFRLFVYGSIAAMLLWRVRLLVQAQREN